MQQDALGNGELTVTLKTLFHDLSRLLLSYLHLPPMPPADTIPCH